MQPSKFAQISIFEVKQDIIQDFNMVCSGNKIALLGTTNELTTLDLILESKSSNIFPYTFANIEISQKRPLAKLLENVNITEIYENSRVQEGQELVLDPMFLNETHKAKVVSIDWAPRNASNGDAILCILNSFGACQVMSKSLLNRRWTLRACDLSEYLLNEIFPLEKTTLKNINFKHFKKVINTYWITAVCWQQPVTRGMQVIFIANAAGCIIALKFVNDEMCEVKEYCKLQTDMQRINYIKSFQHFFLAANVNGIVKLFAMEKHDSVPCFQEIAVLWSKADGMACRKAEIKYKSNLNVYFIIYTKAAHCLAYCLTAEGKVLSKATLHIGGIKITGLEALSNDEFIVTTMLGVVYYIKLEFKTNTATDEPILYIKERIISTDIDAANMQILGIATTANKTLWSFHLYHNKEYAHQFKYSQPPSYISVCKIDIFNNLDILSNLNINTMDPYMDNVVIIRSDILQNVNMEQYNNFLDLTNAKFPNQFDDGYMQQLQLKLLLNRYSTHQQKNNYKTIKRITHCERSFLQIGIQLIYILHRLQFLQQAATGSEGLNAFQKLVVTCMKAKFQLFIDEMINLTNDNENPLKNTCERFVKLLQFEMSTKFTQVFDAITEKCMHCLEEIDKTTLLCSSAHNVERCCVSYVQIPLFNRRFCAQCNALALNDDAALQQLFEPNACIKCTFCRFKFVND